jgi:hypothetical protein
LDIGSYELFCFKNDKVSLIAPPLNVWDEFLDLLCCLLFRVFQVWKDKNVQNVPYSKWTSGSNCTPKKPTTLLSIIQGLYSSFASKQLFNNLNEFFLQLIVKYLEHWPHTLPFVGPSMMKIKNKKEIVYVSCFIGKLSKF